jgi:hypothetical protein
MIALSSRIAIALVVAAVVLQSTEKSNAQSCKPGRQGLCLQAGAHCSPQDPPFSGTQGSCRAINPPGERECICGPLSEPPPPPHQTGIVGNVLSQPTYVNLYWDATWDADNPTMPKDALDGFTSAVVNSSYFQGLAEYGLTSASYAGGFLPDGSCTQKAPGSVGFYDPFNPSIIGFLQCELDHDHSIPQGSQVVYNIILPSGSLESDAFGLDTFCTGGAKAWHFHQRLDSPEAEIAIALILAGGGDGALVGAAIVAAIALIPGGPVYTIQSADGRCGNFINNLVHEMVEAATDPFPPFSVITSGDGEIVDICDNAPNSTPFVPPFPALPAKTFFPQSRRFTTSALISVSSYWSNANQVCLNLSGETPRGSLVNPVLNRRRIIPPNLPISVATTGNGANISFTFSGQGFGTLPSGIGIPSANLPYLAIQDNTQQWQAGNSLNGDAVSLNITSWSDTTITASGLGFGSENNLVMKPNDNFVAWICNPSSGNCGTVSWALQEPGTPELNLLVINSVPLHFNVFIDGNTVASHTGGGFTGWQALAPGNHVISEAATDPGIFTPNFFGGCNSNGQITLQTGDNQICTVFNAFNSGCASGQHCCGSVGKFGCSPECVSNTLACNPICPVNAQHLNKCCGSQTATGECSGECIKSPPHSCQ